VDRRLWQNGVDRIDQSGCRVKAIECRKEPRTVRNCFLEQRTDRRSRRRQTDFDHRLSLSRPAQSCASCFLLRWFDGTATPGAVDPGANAARRRDPAQRWDGIAGPVPCGGAPYLDLRRAAHHPGDPRIRPLGVPGRGAGLYGGCFPWPVAAQGRSSLESTARMTGHPARPSNRTSCR
jgi:hypothetical protein